MPEVTVVAKRFTLVQAANAAGFLLFVFYSKGFARYQTPSDKVVNVDVYRRP